MRRQEDRRTSLKVWIADLKVDSEVEKTTLKQLRQKFVAVSKGKSESGQKIILGSLAGL